MKKMLFVLFAFWLCAPLQGQDTKTMFLEDITGKPFIKMNTDGIEGSAYIWDDWMPGVVTFSNGSTAQVQSLRFSPYNNTLYFLRNGETFEFVESVKQFEITIREKEDQNKFLFRSGYPAIDKQTTSTFYHVLNDGDAQMLRLVQKTIESYQHYNQPEVKKFIDRQYYYAFREGKMSRVKKR